MYTPIQLGLPHATKDDVEYAEFAPNSISRDVVYCFWTLRSRKELVQDFQYLVLPDGCIDIIFDVSPKPEWLGATIMSSDITASLLNLGTSFAYAGVRMQPGAWQQVPIETMGESIERDDLGGVDLVRLCQTLAHCGTQQETGQTLELFVQSLLERSVIGQNDLIQHLLERPMATVEDVMRSSGYSRRHIQRLIRQRVGYSPHDFIRIIRFQRTLTSMRADAYADQPHFIREFKRITGMTPGEFKERYAF